MLNEANSEEKARDSIRILERRRAYGRIYFFYLFVYSGLEFTLCFLTHTRFEYESMQQGRVYLFMGICMIALQGMFHLFYSLKNTHKLKKFSGGYVRRISADRQRNGALIGLASIIPAYVVISVAYNEVLLYVGLFLYAIGKLKKTIGRSNKVSL